MASLCSAFKSLSFGSSVSRAAPLTGARPTLVAVTRSPLIVVAAEKKKKGARTPSAIKRAEIAEVRRARNRTRKSAISTRMKKVMTLVDATKPAAVKSDADLLPIEKLISEAFSEIDRAVSKGVLHDNTGARKKARLAAAKRRLAIAAGLFTPLD